MRDVEDAFRRLHGKPVDALRTMADRMNEPSITNLVSACEKTEWGSAVSELIEKYGKEYGFEVKRSILGHAETAGQAGKAEMVTGEHDIGTGVLGMLGNIIWFVLAGWWLALAVNVFLALVLLWDPLFENDPLFSEETAIALCQGGADVTLSYRKPEFARPKPDNLERIAPEHRPPGGVGGRRPDIGPQAVLAHRPGTRQGVADLGDHRTERLERANLLAEAELYDEALDDLERIVALQEELKEAKRRLKAGAAGGAPTAAALAAAATEVVPGVLLVSATAALPMLVACT